MVHLTNTAASHATNTAASHATNTAASHATNTAARHATNTAASHATNTAASHATNTAARHATITAQERRDWAVRGERSRSCAAVGRAHAIASELQLRHLFPRLGIPAPRELRLNCGAMGQLRLAVADFWIFGCAEYLPSVWLIAYYSG